MSAIDIVNPHYGDELEADPSIANTYLEPRWGYNKAINVDEFANGCADPNILRTMCWTIVTSGGNFHIEDASDPARPVGGLREHPLVHRAVRLELHQLRSAEDLSPPAAATA